MLTTGSLLPDVYKIAVLRPNALGDYLFAVPALHALRAAYPAAEIVLLGKDWHAAFLAGRPGPVNRVVAVPSYPGVGEPETAAPDEDELESFFGAMNRERFDLAIQLYGGGRYSNPFTQQLGARSTAGLKERDAAPLDRWLPYAYFHHEVFRYLEVVALLGARPVILEPEIALVETDRAEARKVVPEDVGPLAVLHPGATKIDRRWPPEKFAAVGDVLAESGLQVAVTGVASEEALVRSVMDSMRAAAINLCGRLSLGGLAGVLSRSRIVVSNDTGPLHLAAAAGAPTVGIYWCVNFTNVEPMTRTRHRPVISWQLECSVCGRNNVYDPCMHPVSYVAGVPVEEVIAQARELLGSR